MGPVIDDSTKPGSTNSVEPPPCDELILPHGQRPTPWKRWEPLDTQTLCLAIIAAGVVFYALYSAKAIMFPLTLAAFLALPLRPIMRQLVRRRVPRFLAASILTGACLSVLAAGLLGLSGPAGEWIEDAPRRLEEAERKLRAIAEPLEGINEATAQVEELTDDTTDDPAAVKVEVQQPRLSSTVLTATGDFVVGSLITVSLAFLLLVFGDDVLRRIIAVMPTSRDRVHLEQVFYEAEQTVSRYLLTYTVINILLGLVIGGGLWLIGLPNPVLWGVMAAVLNYLPFVGLVVGSGVVMLVAILSFDSAAYALLAPAIYLTANGIEANVVTPMLLGRSMKLNTIAIFVSIVVWGWMWGIGGAIIAVPALAVAKIVCDHSERFSRLSCVLSGDPH